jgi:hypothetical protein
MSYVTQCRPSALVDTCHLSVYRVRAVVACPSKDTRLLDTCVAAVADRRLSVIFSVGLKKDDQPTKLSFLNSPLLLRNFFTDNN